MPFLSNRNNGLNMDAISYLRVNPSNTAVGKNDRFYAQQLRINELLRDVGIRTIRTYRDSGVMHTVNFLPEMRMLIKRLYQDDSRLIVAVDHPGRLGDDLKTRSNVIEQITKAKSQIIWPGKYDRRMNKSTIQNSIIASIIKEVESRNV